MTKCPKCRRKLKKVFHGEPTDELAIESFENEVIIGNCCESTYNYYCEYCDEFFQL
jgi:hypothetical protein